MVTNEIRQCSRPTCEPVNLFSLQLLGHDLLCNYVTYCTSWADLRPNVYKMSLIIRSSRAARRTCVKPVIKGLAPVCVRRKRRCGLVQKATKPAAWSCKNVGSQQQRNNEDPYANNQSVQRCSTVAKERRKERGRASKISHPAPRL